MELRQRVPSPATRSDDASARLPAAYSSGLGQVAARGGFVAGVKRLQGNLSAALAPGLEGIYNQAYVMWIALIALALVIFATTLIIGPVPTAGASAFHAPPTSPGFCTNCTALTTPSSIDALLGAAGERVHVDVVVMSACGRGAARDAFRQSWRSQWQRIGAHQLQQHQDGSAHQHPSLARHWMRQGASATVTFALQAGRDTSCARAVAAESASVGCGTGDAGFKLLTMPIGGSDGDGAAAPSSPAAAHPSTLLQALETLAARGDQWPSAAAVDAAAGSNGGACALGTSQKTPDSPALASCGVSVSSSPTTTPRCGVFSLPAAAGARGDASAPVPRFVVIVNDDAVLDVRETLTRVALLAAASAPSAAAAGGAAAAAAAAAKLSTAGGSGISGVFTADHFSADAASPLALLARSSIYLTRFAPRSLVATGSTAQAHGPFATRDRWKIPERPSGEFSSLLLTATPGVPPALLPFLVTPTDGAGGASGGAAGARSGSGSRSGSRVVAAADFVVLSWQLVAGYLAPAAGALDATPRWSPPHAELLPPTDPTASTGAPSGPQVIKATSVASDAPLWLAALDDWLANTRVTRVHDNGVLVNAHDATRTRDTRFAPVHAPVAALLSGRRISGADVTAAAANGVVGGGAAAGASAEVKHRVATTEASRTLALVAPAAHASIAGSSLVGGVQPGVGATTTTTLLGPCCNAHAGT